MSKFKNYFNERTYNKLGGVKVSILTVQSHNMSFSLIHCVHSHTYLADHPSKINVLKNTDMNIPENACFLSLLMDLRWYYTLNIIVFSTCKQGNKYMEICRTILCINMCK